MKIFYEWDWPGADESLSARWNLIRTIRTLTTYLGTTYRRWDKLTTPSFR